MTTANMGIADVVQAAMVECAPEAPEPQTTVPLGAPAPPMAAAEATIEQTGADPPPADGGQ
jgi:hypothetical protein